VLNRVISNLYDAVLKPFGITVNQTTILAMLTLVSEARPGRIGKELHMEKSTISRMIGERFRHRPGQSESPGGKQTGGDIMQKITPFLWFDNQQEVLREGVRDQTAEPESTISRHRTLGLSNGAKPLIK
jgi:hypothetical protein